MAGLFSGADSDNRKGPRDLPPDVFRYMADRGLDACDVACCRAACRYFRDAFPAPHVVHARTACTSAERLAWCLDDAALPPGVALLEAAARSFASGLGASGLGASGLGASGLGALSLAAAAACRHAEKDWRLYRALHGALCSAARRRCEPLAVADLVSDFWEAGGVRLAQVAACDAGAKNRFREAVMSSPDASDGDKARLVAWARKQSLA
jgi:hypothetical protein